MFNLPPQTFSNADIPTIGFLILLEGLLSADNALVMAIMVKHLPEKQQKQALMYGLGGAFVLRFAAILFASLILSLWWLQLIGAAYLVFLAVKHFISHGTHDDAERKVKNMGFWQTVIVVNLVDLAFAVDSVLAAVGIVSAKEKIWVVYVGAILGIILLRFAAGWFIGLLKKYPNLEHMAYMLVGWVGVKLTLISGHSYEELQHKNEAKSVLPFAVPHMTDFVFWGVMAAIIIGGVWYAVKHPSATSEHDIEEFGDILETVTEDDAELSSTPTIETENEKA